VRGFLLNRRDAEDAEERKREEIDYLKVKREVEQISVALILANLLFIV